jgi:hypothetical protein
MYTRTYIRIYVCVCVFVDHEKHGYTKNVRTNYTRVLEIFAVSHVRRNIFSVYNVNIGDNTRMHGVRAYMCSARCPPALTQCVSKGALSLDVCIFLDHVYIHDAGTCLPRRTIGKQRGPALLRLLLLLLLLHLLLCDSRAIRLLLGLPQCRSRHIVLLLLVLLLLVCVCIYVCMYVHVVCRMYAYMYDNVTLSWHVCPSSPSITIHTHSMHAYTYYAHYAAAAGEAAAAAAAAK